MIYPCFYEKRCIFAIHIKHVICRGAMASIPTIVEDMKTNETDGMSDETAVSYIKALKKIFVIEDMPAWNPNLRSKTAIRTSDTRYFVDPSLAIAAFGIGPNDLLNDSETMSLFFETLCDVYSVESTDRYTWSEALKMKRSYSCFEHNTNI